MPSIALCASYRWACAPFPFSIRVPCTHSLCRILLCESGSTCAPSFNACSISLDPFAAALRFWSLLSNGRRLRSLFASLERHYARRILGFGASIRRIDFSSLGAHRVIRSLKTSLQMHFGCSPDLTMLLPMLDLRHPRQNSSPTGFLYACAACSVSEFALREAGRCLVHNPQDRLQLRAQCSRRRLPLLIPQFRPFISPSSIPSVLAAALQSAVPSIAV